ncbi:MAG: glycosyltransferase family 39 protein [Chloroflexi bacterium]|nr:glycosyltransferase family 39 protein [Chloroflexota bacterium]
MRHSVSLRRHCPSTSLWRPSSRASPGGLPLGVWTLLVLIGAWALLAELGARSFWADEVGQVIGLDLGLTAILRGWADPTHPPLSHLLMYLAGGLIGTSDFALRFVGVAPAIVALPVAGKLAEEVFGRRAVAIVLILVATSPFLLLFDRMARYHALVQLFFVLSTLFFLRLWRRWRWSDWAGYVASGALLLYADYLPALGLIAHGLAALTRWRDRRWLGRWLLAPPAIAIAYVPGLLVLLEQLRPNVSVGVLPDDPILSTGLSGFLFRAGYPLYAFLFGETVLPWNWIVVVPATAVAAIVLLRGVVRLSRDARGRCLLVAFAVPLLGAALLMSTILAWHTIGGAAKRLTFLGPIFCVMLAGGLHGLGRRTLAGALVVLVAVSLYASANYFLGEQFINQGYVVPWRAIAGDVLSRAAPGDAIVTGEGAIDRYVGDRLDWFALTAGESDEVARITQALDERQPAGVWIIWRDRGWRPIVDATTAIERHLARGYRLDRTQGYLYTDPTSRFYRESILRRPAAEYYVRVSYYRRIAASPGGGGQ